MSNEGSNEDEGFKGSKYPMRNFSKPFDGFATY